MSKKDLTVGLKVSVPLMQKKGKPNGHLCGIFGCFRTLRGALGMTDWR